MRFLQIVLATGLLATANAAAIDASSHDLSLVERATPFASSCGQKDKYPLATAPGWKHVKLAGGLQGPRGVITDPTTNNLIVVEKYKGIIGFKFDKNGCVAKKITIFNDKSLNHGIAIAANGKYLYASSMTTVWQWNFNSDTMQVSNRKVVIKNMGTSSHSTRTLLIPRLNPFTIVVSHGSDGNLDFGALNTGNARAVVKSFLVPFAPEGGWDWRTTGNLLGYGLRNEVGIVQDGAGGIWGIENSADDLTRTVNGKETAIRNGNPAEELNYLGSPILPNRKWYGYPTCFTVWNGQTFPDKNKFKTGAQFLQSPNSSFTDATCEEQSQAPRLSFEAHSAPIDATFSKTFRTLTITMHGSHDSDIPTGYKIVQVPFKKSVLGLLGYEPVAASDVNKGGYHKILWDTQRGCTSAKCLRPSGITWDNNFQRMFFASDAGEGEVYMLYHT